MTSNETTQNAKKILLLSTSPRLDGNSEMLAAAFAEGAKAAGHSCEKLVLPAKKIDYCIGCMACERTGRCVLRDDGNSILEKMAKADVLVFATPIYFYSISGQLKTLLDRTNPLYESGTYNFRKVYLLTASGDDAEDSAACAVQCIKGWLRCFGKAELAGALNAAGAAEKGSVQTVRDGEYLRMARAMGEKA